MNRQKIAIVGPTASGKTSLALQISQRYNGEIINADSRNIYRSMDIGTAKPTSNEQKLVPHHLLNIRNPDQRYSAREFQCDARRVIARIQASEKLPVVVGATGLYIDSLLFHYQFPDPLFESEPEGSSLRVERPVKPWDDGGSRGDLEKLSDDELIETIKKADASVLASIDLSNHRRLVRAVETIGSERKKATKVGDDWLVIGINPGKEILYKNVIQRAKEQLKSGLIAETQQIIKDYGEHIEALNTVPYREVISHLHGELSLAELPTKIATSNWQLARRQMTWFKRNSEIHWVATPAEGMELAAELQNT